MNSLSRLILAGLLAATSLAPMSRAAMLTEPSAPAQPEATAGDSPEEAAYVQGTKAMDEQRWADAVTAFDRVASAKGKHADAGLYWKAYSLDKLGRSEEARATCETLRQQHRDSSWNRECIVLRTRTNIDIDGLRDLSREMADMNMTMNMDMSGMKFDLGPKLEGLNNYRIFDGKSHVTSEDDIRILALNSLMRQDPAKALPLLRDMLRSDKSVEVKREALFVLSRSKDPQAQSILTEVATTKGNPDLQREALQMLAINRGKDAGPTLVEVYRGSTDAGVKRAAVNGLFLAHDAPRLVDLARGEKDLNLKRDIVTQLALMKDPAATEYMLELLK